MNTIDSVNNTKIITLDTIQQVSDKIESISIMGQPINIVSSSNAFFWNIIINLGVALILAWLVHFFARKILLRIITKFIKKTKTNWDDILLERQFFKKLPGLLLL